MSTELKTLNGYGFDATKLGGLDAQYYAQGRAAKNLLDNSDFRNPVNQRGQSSYSGAVYGIDRWIGNDASSVVTVGTDGITASGNYLVQIIEKKYTGKTLTICAKDANGGIAVATCTVPNATSYSWLCTNTSSTGTFVGILQSDTGVLRAGIMNTNGIKIVCAALYEGAYTADTLPAYVPKGYAAELAECQRYYQTIPALTHIPGVTNTSVSFGAKYKIPTMRIAPTVSIASGQEVSIYTGEYSVSTTNYTMQYATMPNQMILNLSLGAGSFVAYKPGMLTFPVEIALSADL